MEDIAPTNPGRRSFLVTAPAAAAAGLALVDASFATHPGLAQGMAAAMTVQKFSAADLEGIRSAQAAAPGSKNLVSGKSLIVALTTETAKTAPEFEMHEGRDHVFQILEGTTTVEVGGTLDGKHSTGPGEWLAPKSTGAEAYTLSKGDMLVIPRNTPHKRSTAGTVTFLLISSQGQTA